MDTSSSEFWFETVDAEDTFVLYNLYKKLLIEEFSNADERAVCDYEFIFLLNGKQVNDYTWDENDPDTKLYKDFQGALLITYDNAKKEYELILETEEANKAAEKIMEARRQEAIEKKEYERLKAKFAS